MFHSKDLGLMNLNHLSSDRLVLGVVSLSMGLSNGLQALTGISLMNPNR
jgi:hypothetical protein